MECRLADVSGAKLHGGRGRGASTGEKNKKKNSTIISARKQDADSAINANIFTFIHPSTITATAKTNKGICYNFAAGKTCGFGDKCRFKHEKPNSSSSAAADNNNSNKESEGDENETAQFETTNFDCSEHFADNNNVTFEEADVFEDADNDADDDENIDTDNQYLLSHNATPSPSASTAQSSSEWDFNNEFKDTATADTSVTTENEDNPMTKSSADSADAMTESSGADSAVTCNKRQVIKIQTQK